MNRTDAIHLVLKQSPCTLTTLREALRLHCGAQGTRRQVGHAIANLRRRGFRIMYQSGKYRLT